MMNKEYELLKLVYSLNKTGKYPDYKLLNERGFKRSLVNSLIDKGCLINTGVKINITEEGIKKLENFEDYSSEVVKINLILLYKKINNVIDTFDWLNKHIEKVIFSKAVDNHCKLIERLLLEEYKNIKEIISIYNKVKKSNYPDFFVPSLSKDKICKTIVASAFLPNKKELLINKEYIYLLTKKIYNLLTEMQEVVRFISKPNLSIEETEKLDSLKNQLNKWKNENFDYMLLKNLKVAVEELENGHRLASFLICGRVVDYCINKMKIEKKSDEEIEKILKDSNLAKDKDTLDQFIKAIKNSRNVSSHKISYFPEPHEAYSILGDAFRIVEMNHKFLLKSGGLENEN